MIQRAGRATWLFQQQPSVIGYASVVGKKETEGPLGEGFDRVIPDSYNGCDTYEEAAARMQRSALRLAAAKCNLEAKDIDCVFAGDLLNQCIGSSFGLKNLGIPYLGQYAACATMAQSLMMAAMMVESGAVKTAACVTSSHFCAAERQYRFPLEYGSVRTPTAQWTVTGAGGCVLQRASEPLRVAAATVGKITDLEMTDPNNMGAAMAPAAAETILRFFSDTGTAPDEYDRVFTGDLGQVGSDLLHRLLLREGCDLRSRHSDCGLMIFDRTGQDVHAGGSGCGCCASVLCSEIFNSLRAGKFRNILFVATGALLSITSAQQSKTIPAIAHLVNFRAE